jgi:hypothetical protein
MASTAMEIDLESVSDAFESIFTLSLPILQLAFDSLAIPVHLKPTTEFMDSLTEEQQTNTLKICIICWITSNCTILPRPYQLQATLAILEGKDSLIDGSEYSEAKGDSGVIGDDISGEG